MVEPLPVSALRWRCDPASLAFATTADVEPETGVVSQEIAVEALRFGIECDAPGQNVFVRGLTGTGRMTLVERLLDELMPVCPLKQDRAYVHDFRQPARPRLLTLPPGMGRVFRRRVREVREFVRDGLAEALASDALKARRESIEHDAKERADAITRPFEADLKEAGLAVVQRTTGQMVQTGLFPLVEGEPTPPEEFLKLQTQGKVSDEAVEAWRTSSEAFGRRMIDVSSEVNKVRIEAAESIARLVESTAREILGGMLRGIREKFPGADVERFLGELLDDVIERLTTPAREGEDPTRYYDVNLLLEHDEDPGCPIVVENTPTLTNLLGAVDREWTPRGPLPGDFHSVRAGSMLRADGGYLILDARDVLVEPGAWRVLMRTLRTGQLEIVPPELASPMWQSSIQPEPIPVRLRVILVGDSGTYHALDQGDPEFGQLFKVLADFDSEIPREQGQAGYAGVLARIAKDEGLLPFDREAVAALVEHGARIAARHGKLTARFGRVADIAREAAFLAAQARRAAVTGDDVLEAVTRTKRRANLPSRRFQAFLADGTIHVATRGAVVGQINGLAVMSAGLLTYGFPARITATIGPGSAGIIDIEGSASLSGQIHTKGFHILGGLLRHLLHTEHALAFSASLAFEQSYGGIDGDSASGAEICCLLSALTGVPIRQSLAMTGAIDQHGRIQAIGGVNEKIEGFFDTCMALAAPADGEQQGVIIPTANAGDLMLRHDVVAACEAGRFCIWAVESVSQALELLTGVPSGKWDPEAGYPEGTLLGRAVDEAAEYWEKTLTSPTVYFAEEDAEAPEAVETEPPPV